MENYTYIGWIPCINGHLDFGLMRVGIKGGFTNSKSTDVNTIEVNFTSSDYGDSHNRRIVLQSKVDWRDSPEFSEDSGYFRLIVTAEVNESHSMNERYLTGNLLIYPASAEPDSIKQRYGMNVHNLCHSIESNTKDLRKNFKRLNKITSAQPASAEPYEIKQRYNMDVHNLRHSIENGKKEQHEDFNRLDKITSAQEEVDNLNYFSCSIRFKIEQNGITQLRYNSENSTLDEESKYLIARQAFYYLKYSIHTHKHHTTKQDSLTTITPMHGNSAEDKSNAGLRLICQLKRELTFIQRIQSADGKEHPTNNAVGIVAYVKSLVCSLEQMSIIGSSIAKEEQERLNHVKASFIAQNCKMDNQFRNAELIKSKSKVWLGFIIISLWGILNFLFKPNYENKETISTTEFFTCFTIIIATVFMTYIAIKRFYYTRQLPEASEHLYHIKYSWIIAKMVVAAIVIAILLKNFVP